MRSESEEFDPELIAQLAALLDEIGPFTSDTLRKDKWRTTEQLAHALFDRYGRYVDLDHLEDFLNRYEYSIRERMNKGLPPDALIRRATYPDRTTALPLWGSTKHHGQPWQNQALPQRMDSPADLPSELRLPESAPRVFMSHTHQDANLVTRLAQSLAGIGIGVWMFETHVDYHSMIASCVRSAIASAAQCIALVTCTSMASLWVLTELHTALQVGKQVTLVINVEDGLLLDLFKSVQFQTSDALFDHSIIYDKSIVGQMGVDYSRYHSATRAARYVGQVHDFLVSLPLYLSGRPALAYPSVPMEWSGSFPLAPVNDLLNRIKMQKG